MNISLPNELARYVREKVQGGRYSSISEVVREALRRLSADEARQQPFQTLSGATFDARAAADAARRIRELQQRQSLGGDLSLEDLIQAGRQV
ncbi:MAG: type II toxin-antitoxin system ParD family antitoxin [Planctomycetes bacterium]|nr:type II toxin-antitoxin system ParD family antitoxin [Planctomycetota bacterium]